VPNCSSNPSAVRDSGGTMTPALLISRFTSPAQPAANSRMEARSARSSRVGPQMVAAEQLDELVADYIAHFLRGSRAAV